MKITCPDCQQEFEAKNELVVVGEILDCQNCGAEMEVLSLEPFKVELILEEK